MLSNRVLPLSLLADEPDNRILEAAGEARVDAIVTGDADRLELASYNDIPIMSPATFAKHHFTRPPR
jgi:predicted nucleic acid-binding protein